MNAPRNLTDFIDGASKTIQLIEIRALNVNWMEPRDFSMDEALQVLTTSDCNGHELSWSYGLFSLHKRYSGRHISCADGHCRYFPPTSETEMVKAILTLDGQEDVDVNADSESIDKYRSECRPHYGRIFPTALFIALAILPAFRLNRLRPPSPARGPSPS